MLLDLRPYGINLILDSSEAGFPEVKMKMLRNCIIRGKKIIVNTKTYDVKLEIAKGTYGEVYSASSDTYGDVVLKIIRIGSEAQFTDFLKEAIIQILLQETSRDQPNGPYVPEVYDVFYDMAGSHAYIVTQKMYSTMHDYVDAFTRKDRVQSVLSKDLIVPLFFRQIATILEFFQRTLQFNHRDMKGNNVMYVKDAADNRIVKIIDFGFSCLKWGNMSIRGGDYFKDSDTCFRRERDMAQLMVYALQYFKPISRQLKTYLIEMLKAEVAGEPCSVGEGCMYHGKSLVKNYINTYNFYNRANVVSTFASPNTVLAHINRFEKKLPFNATVLGAAAGSAAGVAGAGAPEATGVLRGTGAPANSGSVFIDIAPPAAGAAAARVAKGTGAPANSGSVFIDIAPLAAKAGAGAHGGTRRRTQNKRSKRTRYHKK